jgi:hypothetical protein
MAMAMSQSSVRAAAQLVARMPLTGACSAFTAKTARRSLAPFVDETARRAAQKGHSAGKRNHKRHREKEQRKYDPVYW